MKTITKIQTFDCVEHDRIAPLQTQCKRYFQLSAQMLHRKAQKNFKKVLAIEFLLNYSEVIAANNPSGAFTMNTTYKDFSDDVSGVIVGTYYQQAFLTYEGRKQGPTIYARTNEEAKEVANEYIQRQREEFGEAFAMIYPNKAAWQVKFV